MGVKGKSGRKRGVYYVCNEELTREVKKYYDTGIFSNELGRYINKIVDGVAHMPKVINYFKEDNPWGNEMYSDAIYRISNSIVEKKCKLENEEGSSFEVNLFGYFTKTAWHAFIARINLEKRNQRILESYKDKMFEDFETEYGIVHQTNNEDRDYDNF